ncbi:post-transcriptional regulator [Virgibacillus sp. MSJ-26]|uniref:post-transcriptional regulator n=1 Tax=Virgibacillus sp. MSJ-26 TaxID=2841522 RepID=UPI001C0FDE93|nr:post-transcriptional regulator [Virgibacillus sp. MSJ-26]MBU5466503.1 post-transcriptional regulator [Virgibacillus sp. MSJ-26]
MEAERSVEEWREKLIPALESKVEEFHLMGYNQATIENIWTCLQEKVWKGTPHKRLHEVTQDIFHLSGPIFMSYLTVDAYKDDSNLMSSIQAVMGGK